jgi:prevent-host-death family protein
MEKVSKSQFKAKALEYFRSVEKTGKPLVITDHGDPKLIIAPYVENPERLLAELRGSVLGYDDPLEPVALSTWLSLGSASLGGRIR